MKTFLKIATIIGAILAIALALTEFVGNKKPDLGRLAVGIISKCRSAGVKSVCYEKEIPKLAEYLSMEESFEVTERVQAQDTTFPYCHVLGHKIATLETKRDPSKWKEVIARCPAGVCSNGCVHGAFQERYRNDVLTKEEFLTAKEEFKTVCEANGSFNPTGLEQGSCYHAIGHLLMYITSADIVKAADTCDEISKKADGRDFTKLCYAGAFMQIYQPLDTDDKSLVSNFKLNDTNTWEFCSSFPTERRNSCWEEAWPIFLKKISTGPGLVDYCSKLDKAGKERCMTNLLYIMPIQFVFDFNAIKKYCLTFPQPYQGRCLAMTASRVLEIDKRNGQKTIDFCSSLEGENMNACFDQVLNDASFDFKKESDEYKNICAKIPEPWKSKCK